MQYCKLFTHPVWLLRFYNVVFLYICLLAAIIGIIGCADALKATSLFGRIPNANKTTTTSSTTTTIAPVTAEAVKTGEV